MRMLDQPRLHVALKHGCQNEHPQIPKMMLGTAANSSTATPIGRFRIGGHNSVRNSAIPNPAGTASAMAIRDVTTVP